MRARRLESVTRNDSDEAASEPREQAVRRHQEYMDSPAGARHQRQPLNWPTAAFGLGVIALLAFVAWICGGVAGDIWGGQ